MMYKTDLIINQRFPEYEQNMEISTVQQRLKIPIILQLNYDSVIWFRKSEKNRKWYNKIIICPHHYSEKNSADLLVLEDNPCRTLPQANQRHGHSYKGSDEKAGH